MTQGADALVAGAALDAQAQHLGLGIVGPRANRVGGAEEGHLRPAEGGGHMHQAGIIADHRIGEAEQRHRLIQAGAPGQILHRRESPPPRRDRPASRRPRPASPGRAWPRQGWRNGAPASAWRGRIRRRARWPAAAPRRLQAERRQGLGALLIRHDEAGLRHLAVIRCGATRRGRSRPGAGGASPGPRSAAGGAAPRRSRA